jgi:hypothetical protein
VQKREKDAAKRPSRARGGEGGDHIDEALGQAQQSGTQGRQHTSQRSTQFSTEASRRTDEAARRAAGTMEDAANALREGGERAGSAQIRAADRVADRMERTAGYLRENDTAHIVDDVENFIREHPLRSLAGAMVGGFVIARILR